MNRIPALAGDRQRCAEFPSRGDLERRGVVYVVGLVALGIKQDLVPADDGEFGGGGGSGRESAFQSRGREEVEFGIDLGDSAGNLNMNGEAVEQVAAPLQSLAVRFEEQSRQI